MTPHDMLNGELKILSTAQYGLTPNHITSFIYGWYSDSMVWIRIFYRAQTTEWFSFKIETEDDISTFRKKMVEALRRAKR